jgi:hypothetical protein
MKKGNLNNPSSLSWTFLDGSERKATILDSVVIGKGKYLPGWKWSLHVGPITGKLSEKHIGLVLEGEMMIKDHKGNEMSVSAGEVFEVEAGHDAWVLGDIPCIAIDYMVLEK